MEVSGEDLNPYKVFEKRVKAHKHVCEAVCGSQTVIDLSSPEDYSCVTETARINFMGSERSVYGFKDHDGLYVITGALPVWAQLEAAHFALSQCPEYPNSTNLGPSEATGIWDKNKSILDSGKKWKEQMVDLRTSELGHLRWSALGYQYEWTSRTYPQTSPAEESSDSHEVPQRFPPALSHLIKELVNALPMSGMLLEPEAAIVNYYVPGKIMGGHVDNAELTHEHPVVSLSIGRPCAFLVGGTTKDETPISILLRSGDCVILSGGSRLRYHGVGRVFDCPFAPRVRKDPGCNSECMDICTSICGPESFEHMRTDKTYSKINVHRYLAGMRCRDLVLQAEKFEDSHLYNECKEQSDPHHNVSRCTDCGVDLVDSREVERVVKFLEFSRININVRQVFPSGHDTKK